MLLYLGFYFCNMKFIQWFVYLLFCAALIWFAFIRIPNQVDNLEPQEDVNEDEFAEFTQEELIPEDENLEEEAVIDSFVEDTFEYTDFESFEDETVSPEPEIQSYIVVAGSFGTQSNADKMVNQLSNQGVNAEVQEIGGMFRVIVGSGNSMVEANAIVNDMSSSGIQSFVMKR